MATTVGAFVLGTPDPTRLAALYRDLLGWETVEGSEDADPTFIRLRAPEQERPGLSFQLEPDHVPPTRPARAGTQQMPAHVDVLVDDLDAEVSRAEVRRVCHHMIEQIDSVLVVPGAAAASISGVVLSLVTPWGLTRYRWVLPKLVLTVAVIVYSTSGVGVWVEQSILATATTDAESPVAGPLAYGALLNIVAFLFMTWLSVAEPWGTTPWVRPHPARRARPSPA